MNPDLTGDPLAGALAATLERAAEQVPVTVPDWDGVRAGMRRARRRRRQRTAGRAGGGVLGVICLLGGIQVGVLPYPSWAPTVTVPSSPTHGFSALAQQPTRGSLAGDRVWLDTLRRRVARYQLDGPGLPWRARSSDDVRVVFAGDVGEYRVALVELRLRAGLLESGLQLWLSGARGATVTALVEQGSTAAPPDPAVASFEQLPGGRSTAPITVIVSTAQPKVELAGPATVDARGRVHWNIRTVAAQEQGVWTITTGSSGVLGGQFIRIGDTPWQSTFGGSSHDSWSPASVSAADRVPVHRSSQPLGAGPFGDEKLAGQVSDVQAYLIGLGTVTPAAGGTTTWTPTRPPVHLLWRGSMAGWDVQAVAVTAPGGGQIVSVLTSTAPSRGDDGDMSYSSRSHVTIVGALPPDRISAAFQLFPPTYRGDDPPATAVGLIGGVAAVRARVTDAAGRVHEVPLADGVGTAPVSDAVSAVFVDAGGKVLDELRIAPARGNPLAVMAGPGLFG